MKKLELKIEGCCDCPYVTRNTDQNQCIDIAECGHPDVDVLDRVIAWRWESIDIDDYAPYPKKGFIAAFCPLMDMKDECKK